MGINMNLENSRRQAESIEKEMKNKIEGYEGLIRAITKIGLLQHSQVNGHNFTIRFLGKTDLNLPFHIQFFYFIWSVIPNCRVRSF